MTEGREIGPVVVELDGRRATWDAAAGFDGDPSLVGKARFAALVGLEVPLGDTTVIAGDASTTAAAAALVVEDPQRVRILVGPADLVSR